MKLNFKATLFSCIFLFEAIFFGQWAILVFCSFSKRIKQTCSPPFWGDVGIKKWSPFFCVLALENRHFRQKYIWDTQTSFPKRETHAVNDPIYVRHTNGRPNVCDAGCVWPQVNYYYVGEFYASRKIILHQFAMLKIKECPGFFPSYISWFPQYRFWNIF